MSMLLYWSYSERTASWAGAYIATCMSSVQKQGKLSLLYKQVSGHTTGTTSQEF